MKTLAFASAVVALVVFSSAQACPYKDRMTKSLIQDDQRVTEVSPVTDRKKLIVDIEKPVSTAN